MPTLEDLVLDVPLCGQTFGHYLQVALSKGKLELSELTTILAPLKGDEEANLFKVLAAVLNFTNEAEGAEKLRKQPLKSSGQV